ncbi:hypothetical protein KKH23_10160 [Patescibacteria group bacterium]|nr:hypothetical protein [Patescibacteria group bacterium]
MTKILGNFEQETIITFNKGEDMACIFTYERTWQRQIEQKLGIQPTFNNGCGGKEYQVPKKRIRMPQPKRVYSAEQKQKMAKRLAARRPQKSIISARNTAAVGLSAAKKSRGANNTSHAKSKAK